jgi:hypothetical protein
MWKGSRRGFLKTATAATAAAVLTANAPNRWLRAQSTGEDAVAEVLYPRARVPLSFIIDDSTCLVNMGHFCTPQFATAHPNREQYQRDWRSWPREIPDAFVREFGQWCAEHGVKGKYSVVPYPACVGWLDRELPGWSRRELLDSLKLVRELMVPNWDIHPEMITHTRVIDLKTGRPFAEISPATMENSYPQEDKSVDELAAYLAYALRIVKNCDLPCQGITTPGGFGNRVKSELSLAVQQAVQDVYQVEVPHYFKYVKGGDQSTEPMLEHVRGRDTDNPQFTVNIPAGTGDWFGGWQGDEPSEGSRYSNDDATSGRMVELIQRGQPALMLCHWPGMYCHGSKRGFADFQRVVTALDSRFRDQTLWMTLSEIARYWAAKELTRIDVAGNSLTLNAPIAAPAFTLSLPTSANVVPKLTRGTEPATLTEVKQLHHLKPDSWLHGSDRVVLCFDLPKGRSVVELA